MTQAGREIREAALLLREHPQKEAAPADVHVPASLAWRLIPRAARGRAVARRCRRIQLADTHDPDASARADAAERQANDTRRDANRQIASIERSAQQASSEALSTAARAERMINVLAAPDSRRTMLLPQPTAAAASGQALWSASRGVVITGTRLPAVSADETYQAWLVTSRGPVSLGLLTPDARGRVSAAFDLPPDAGAIWGFMVTREPAAGSARPSRTVVLAS